MAGAGSKTTITNEVYKSARIDGAGNVYIYSPVVTGDVRIYDDIFNGGAGSKTTITNGSYASGVTHTADGSGSALGTTVFSSPHYQTTLVLRVDFDAPYPDVSRVSCWIRQSDNDSGTFEIEYFDSALASLGTFNSNTPVLDAWAEREDTTNYTGVRRLVFTLVSGLSFTPNTAYIDEIEIDGTGGAACRKSTDGGLTFAAAVNVGESPGSSGGFSVVPTMSGNIYAAIASAVSKSTDGGLTFAEDANGQCTGSYPAAIFGFPAGYIFSSAAAVSGASLWRVISSQVDITPTDGGNVGLPVGQHCLYVDFQDTNRIYAILNFAGQVKLARSTNGGTSWTITAPFSNSALSIDGNPYSAGSAKQLIVADNATLWYSPNAGSNWYAKQAAAASTQAAFFRR